MPESNTKTGISIRKACKSDTPLILSFIRQLAEYEKMSGEVVATQELLEEVLFGEYPSAEVVLAYCGSAPAGFAIYFFNFSTFLGRPGLYLEDLFVSPELRGKGIGKALLVHLAGIAVNKKCGRFEWSVLDWNEPAIKFYRSLGARPMDEWTVFRIDGEGLKKLAEIKMEK
ncbi:MAG: GNAT family N-acetyltransferase [Ignavibacteria bacterium]|jgi:GNAT superfamily N-acetyltransferase|nr:GNAT family N-acetyltransferase [Ignavibacteria bacterium]MCU7502594.1 GNAT family N-acetyltransferase [Ignavibacteria bacterium]MCU7515203.1 GNAT family N-acetyltransferase [Ignavibacteria bacterium]